MQRTALCLAILFTVSGVASAQKPKAVTGKSSAPSASQNPTSGRNGISVNARDDAQVEILQTIYNTDPALSKALVIALEDRRREQAKREKAEQESGALKKERDTLASDLELAQTYLRIAQDASKQDAGETVKKARQALLVGDLKEAERLLQVDEEQFAAAATRNLRKAAQLARERATLAEGQDTAKALSALRKAAEYEPDNTKNWWRLGDILVTSGNLVDAVKAYERFQALAMDEVRRDPGNNELQRDLSVSNHMIGDVQVAQGDLSGALKSYSDGLGILRQLAGRDPGNSGWQRDLSVSNNKIGDVQVAQGDLSGALKSYSDGLGIAKLLAGRDPLNVQWTTDVAVSLYKLASLAPKGLSSGKAVALLREALDILEKLDKQGKLTASQQAWLPMFTKRLSELEKFTSKE